MEKSSQDAEDHLGWINLAVNLGTLFLVVIFTKMMQIYKVYKI